jgi:hypothetical protein
MVSAKRPVSKTEPVGVSAKLRRANAWFEDLATKVKNEALKRRRTAGRNAGKELDSLRIVELADELENLQRQMNPLEIRRKEIVEDLVAHWAHTGVEEIEGLLGKTLISQSFELGINPRTFQAKVTDAVWQKITERRIEPAKLLAEAKRNDVVKSALEKALLVRKMKVSVTAPSSRRPKSGAPEDEESGEE